MSCEIISSRKLDYYINDPYAQIIDVRCSESEIKPRINNSKHVCFDEIMDDINQNKRIMRFIKIFRNKNILYILICDKGISSLLLCEKLSKLGYNCKTILGGISAYNGKYLVNNCVDTNTSRL